MSEKTDSIKTDQKATKREEQTEVMTKSSEPTFQRREPVISAGMAVGGAEMVRRGEQEVKNEKITRMSSRHDCLARSQGEVRTYIDAHMLSNT